MKKIIILEGGKNEEHEISLNSSQQVQKSLKRMRINFEVFKVNPKNFQKKLKNYPKELIFFNALHGPFGEDGNIQKILEENKRNYTHSNSKSSSIAFDKNLTKNAIKNSGINVLNSIVVNKSKIKKNILIDFFNKNNSFVMKPVKSGSSFGIKIFETLEEINSFFLNFSQNVKLYENHNELMLEKFINGRELTVGVFEKNGIAESIEVTEIISYNNKKIYDYESKYTKGLSKHILPAKVTSQIYNKCLLYAKIVHEKIGCTSLSRSDFLLYKNEIYFLEINSQPGLTSTSLLPEQLNSKKISFDEVINSIIESSL